MSSSRKFCQSCEDYPSGAFVCVDCHRDKLHRARKRHSVAKKTRDESAAQFQDLLVEQTNTLAEALECHQLEQRTRALEQQLREQKQAMLQLQQAKHAWEKKYKERKLELDQAESRLAVGQDFRLRSTLPVLQSLELTTRHVELQVRGERRKKMEQLFQIFPVSLPGGICGLEVVSLTSSVRAAGVPPTPPSIENEVAFDLVGRMVILAAHYLKVPLMHKLSYSKGDVWLLVGKTGEVQRVHASAPFFKIMAVDSRMLAEHQHVSQDQLSSIDFLVNLHKLFAVTTTTTNV